jgi:TPR repeat protein
VGSTVPDRPPQLQLPEFDKMADMPHFSPFPPINAKPNVPPSDEEKERILENARIPVLNSNDPEMQLAWAQDVLAYVATAQLYEERIAISQPKRPVTPAVEHQLREDAMNVVSFLADQHHPKAEFMKGMWLEFGNFGVRQDKREAFRCYNRAAENGYSRSEYRMGMQFEQNNDPVKALIHYQRGAAAGDSASNYVSQGSVLDMGRH